jgi:hypothetical protein
MHAPKLIKIYALEEETLICFNKEIIYLNSSACFLHIRLIN